VALATKVAGPVPGHGLGSRRRGDLTRRGHRAGLRGQPAPSETDVIDLYQIHWPNRHAAGFGALTSDPAGGATVNRTSKQLRSARPAWCKAGKVRAHRPVQRDALGVMRFPRGGRAAGAAHGVGAEPLCA
jgi:aryl-alcohol dehydrogenase-like predicted oxidoreductase